VRESGAAREEQRPEAGRCDDGAAERERESLRDRGGWGSGGREGGVKKNKPLTGGFRV
jgi:hypothetical protein